MGHASITVTAHTYADLFDEDPDDIAAGCSHAATFGLVANRACAKSWPHFGPMEAFKRTANREPEQ